MAQNIFEQYGIKEVADVQFEALESDTRLGVSAGDIVMYLDTLKISTIETTASQTEAKGGKGAPPLIIWDFGKEINVSLQDALFTTTSLAVMTSAAVKAATASEGVRVRYTQDATMPASGGSISLEHEPVKVDGTKYQIRWLDLTSGKRGQVDAYTPGSGETKGTITITGPAANARLKLFYDVDVKSGSTTDAYEITIDSENFPGTYKVFGDTVVRNTNGKDTPFQFVIPRAKVGSEVTFTMEAEGDPAVFDMSLRVLRGDDKNMIKFVKYTFR